MLLLGRYHLLRHSFCPLSAGMLSQHHRLDVPYRSWSSDVDPCPQGTISTPRPGWEKVTYSLIDRRSAFPLRSFAYACAKPRIGHHHYFNVTHHRNVSLLNHSLNPESGRVNGSTSLLIRGRDREVHLIPWYPGIGTDMKILSRWKNSTSVPSFTLYPEAGHIGHLKSALN
ncbi:hypothetical protein OG21DRAFT_1066993 [Imleria badia]|nr:hypothetical protein OG21DRAFT_1066993 [Imleria badia]